jgi:hypothetical protein
MAAKPIRAVEVWVRWFVWRAVQVVFLLVAGVLYYVTLEINRAQALALRDGVDDTLEWLLKVFFAVLIGLIIGLMLKDFSKIPLRVRLDVPTGLAHLAVASVLCLIAALTEVTVLIQAIGRDLELPAYYYSPWTFPYIWLGLALTGFLQVSQGVPKAVPAPTPAPTPPPVEVVRIRVPASTASGPSTTPSSPTPAADTSPTATPPAPASGSSGVSLAAAVAAGAALFAPPSPPSPPPASGPSAPPAQPAGDTRAAVTDPTLTPVPVDTQHFTPLPEELTPAPAVGLAAPLPVEPLDFGADAVDKPPRLTKAEADTPLPLAETIDYGATPAQEKTPNPEPRSEPPAETGADGHGR